MLNEQENRIAVLEQVVPTFATQEKLDKLRTQYTATAANQSILEERMTNEEKGLIRAHVNITALNEAVGLNKKSIQDNHEETSMYDLEVATFLRPRVVVSLALLGQHACVKGTVCLYRALGAAPNDYVHWTNTTTPGTANGT